MKENAWPELNKPEYIERVDGMIEKCSERGQRVYSPTAGGFNVLNHGDFFLRNMLFRNIDGKICDVQFVSTKKERTFFFSRFFVGSLRIFLFPMQNIKIINRFFELAGRSFGLKGKGGRLQIGHLSKNGYLATETLINSSFFVVDEI
jgi:Ecdysteroid kinase-like family